MPCDVVSVPQLSPVPGVGHTSGSAAFASPVSGRRGTSRRVKISDIILFFLCCLGGPVPLSTCAEAAHGVDKVIVEGLLCNVAATHSSLTTLQSSWCISWSVTSCPVLVWTCAVVAHSTDKALYPS